MRPRQSAPLLIFYAILTNKLKIAIISTGTARTAGGWSHHPKGGEAVRITLHIGPYTVTIIVKRRNRHPGR